MKKQQLNAVVLAAAAGMTLIPTGHAQSVDSLLNKLVDRGVLTKGDADELRQESNEDFRSALAANMGSPNWVSALKFNGDFRGRLDYLGSDNSAFTDRYRLRYRLRAGVTAKFKDHFEVGFRLGTGDSGGNALSNNTTLENNATKKPVWIDTAYATWTPIHDDEWTASATIGKMLNPFALSPMVFDPDYTPEGAAVQDSWKINDQNTVKFNGGIFVLDELAGSGTDPFMYGGQFIWDAKWSSKVESSLGIAMLDIAHKQQLSEPPAPASSNVPNNNTGNTRDAAGNLLNNFNPVVVSASVTYKADHFPLYQGAFPIKVGGEYMNNPAAGSNNEGWWGGVTFGKANKRGNWDLSYRYQRLESDAWYEEVVDDDNAAFYQTAATGGKSGMVGGSNIEGHLVKLNYRLSDSLTFTFTGYFNELINASPAGSKSGGNHVMADVMWKF